jgi:hypothetical protein
VPGRLPLAESGASWKPAPATSARDRKSELPSAWSPRTRLTAALISGSFGTLSVHQPLAKRMVRLSSVRPPGNDHLARTLRG